MSHSSDVVEAGSHPGDWWTAFALAALPLAVVLLFFLFSGIRGGP